MGIQRQPCCCGKWLAITEKGWMYDLDIDSGEVSNPRFFGVAKLPGKASGGLASIAKHPQTGRLYSHQHALDDEVTSNLYELSPDGTATLIGPVRPAYHNSDPLADRLGLANGGNVISSSGVLYANAWNGLAARHAKLMTIDLGTGAGNPYSNNFNGYPVVPPVPPATVPTFPVTDSIYGLDFHPDSGVLFAFGRPAASSTQTANYNALMTVSTITGLRDWKASAQNSDAFFDLKFDGGVLYGVYDKVYRIEDLSTGQVIAGPTITGFVPGDANYLTGLVRLD